MRTAGFMKAVRLHLLQVLFIAGLLHCCAATGATPVVAFISPSGGEAYIVGQAQTVQLNSKLKSVLVELSTDGGATFSTLGTINNLVKDLTQRNVLKWTVQGPVGANCIMRAGGSSGKVHVSVLSGAFSITEGSTAGGIVFGQALSGSSPNPGLQVTNGDGIGVYGIASASSGGASGVVGGSASPDGPGIFGNNTATTGAGAGVYGSSASIAGNGVWGNATATTGRNSGVSGTSASPNGMGVLGKNLATSGPGVGVEGSIASPDGAGVFGSNTATTGKADGVVGASASPAGAGVYGYNTATTGFSPGVSGFSASTTGMGVYGSNNSTTGQSVGVRGDSASPNGLVFTHNLHSADTLTGGIGRRREHGSPECGWSSLATSGVYGRGAG